MHIRTLSVFIGVFILNICRNIESVLSILAKAGSTKGLESVVETWVSVLENHASTHRTLGQDRLVSEGMIAINGPEVVHCDTVVREGLKAYWAKTRRAGYGEGHWIRRSEHIKCYTVSKAVDTLTKKKQSVLFMV